MRLSVLMTVRDGESYLAEALDSLLLQSRPAEEVVVVNDGSTDRTAQILEARPRVRVLTTPPRGIAAGLNAAFAATTGDLVAFLDADDICPSESLAVRLDALGAAPAVGGLVEQFVSPELTLTYKTGRPTAVGLLGAVLFRRSTLAAHGPFDESNQLAPCVDWMAQARGRGLVAAQVDQVVLRRRMHDRNHSLRSLRTSEAMLDIVRRQHRRRSSEG